MKKLSLFIFQSHKISSDFVNPVPFCSMEVQLKDIRQKTMHR
jgi:hypothetical protein